MPRNFIRGFFFARLKCETWLEPRLGGTTMESGGNLREQLNRNPSGVAAAALARPTGTYGDVFADGSLIELIGGDQGEKTQLMLWNGVSEMVGSVVERDGRLYEPALTDGSVVRALTLPTRCRPHGSTHELLAEICKLVIHLVGLDDKSASLVGRKSCCVAMCLRPFPSLPPS